MTQAGFSFAPPRPRRRTENVVPMINVVFLLLIFFLISAQIAPPPPFDIAPATTDDAPRQQAHDQTLWIDAEGTLSYGGAGGEDVWQRLGPDIPHLHLRADAATPAKIVARTLARLNASGTSNVTLITTQVGSQ